MAREPRTHPLLEKDRILNAGEKKKKRHASKLEVEILRAGWWEPGPWFEGGVQMVVQSVCVVLKSFLAVYTLTGKALPQCKGK